MERVIGAVIWRMPRLVVPGTARPRAPVVPAFAAAFGVDAATGAPAPAGAPLRDGIRKRPPRRDDVAPWSCWVMRSPWLLRRSRSGRGALGRRRDVAEDLVDALLDGRPGELRLGVEEQTVAQDGLGEQLDVVRHDVGAALARRPRLRASDVGEAATDRQAELERGVA